MCLWERCFCGTNRCGIFSLVQNSTYFCLSQLDIVSSPAPCVMSTANFTEPSAIFNTQVVLHLL